MQAPGGNDVRLNLVQGLFRTVGKLKSQLGVGGGSAPGPFEDKFLAFTRHPGEHRCETLGPDEGELDLEVFIETRDDAGGVEW